MTTTLLVVLNITMSLAAVGAVLTGVLVASRLKSPPHEGRAHWRGPRAVS
jgi:hypothetical protein